MPKLATPEEVAKIEAIKAFKIGAATVRAVIGDVYDYQEYPRTVKWETKRFDGVRDEWQTTKHQETVTDRCRYVVDEFGKELLDRFGRFGTKTTVVAFLCELYLTRRKSTGELYHSKHNRERGTEWLKNMVWKASHESRERLSQLELAIKNYQYKSDQLIKQNPPAARRPGARG